MQLPFFVGPECGPRASYDWVATTSTCCRNATDLTYRWEHSHHTDEVDIFTSCPRRWPCPAYLKLQFDRMDHVIDRVVKKAAGQLLSGWWQCVGIGSNFGECRNAKCEARLRVSGSMRRKITRDLSMILCRLQSFYAVSVSSKWLCPAVLH